MKRIMMCLTVALLLAASAADAGKRYRYEFPWQPANKGIASFFQQVGISSPPAIETDQEISVEDATMVLETGTYDTVHVRSNDILYFHEVQVTGTLTVEPGAYLLPASQNSWITILGGATSNWGAPGGAFIQILGDPATTNTEFLTSGISMELNSSTVIHNVLVTSVAYGVTITAPLAEAQVGSEPPPAICEATGLYLTNNNEGITIAGSTRFDLRQSASWDNTGYALQVYMNVKHIRMNAAESWFQGNMQLEMPWGIESKQELVFDRCALPDGFVDWLYASGDSRDFRTRFWVTVLENRPTGLGQTRVKVYPLASPLSPVNFTGSGEVSVEDAVLLLRAFGSQRDSVAFGNLYDLNADGMVNLPDMMELAYAFAGIDRSEPIAALGNSGPIKDQLLPTIVQYPAIRDAAKADALVDPDGFGSLVQAYLQRTVVAEVGSETPDAFGLGQNYPNPFNSGTTIRFRIPVEADVTLAVYNTAGQVVARLVDEALPAGVYIQQWDGFTDNGAPAGTGTYFYRLTAGEYAETHRMTLLR